MAVVVCHCINHLRTSLILHKCVLGDLARCSLICQQHQVLLVVVELAVEFQLLNRGLRVSAILD